MKLRHLPYYFFIILFSCVEPTLVSDKDCSGVIGGDAIVDECGVCGGPGKTGCDNTCGSTLQLDCTYDLTLPMEHPINVAACGGNAKRDCDGNCNGTHHLEYFCEEYVSVENLLDLSKLE